MERPVVMLKIIVTIKSYVFKYIARPVSVVGKYPLEVVTN